MANSPVTPVAYEYLSRKGVYIIPDILSNSGGVIGSYIEWKQNVTSERYSDQKALLLLESILSEVFEQIWEMSVLRKISIKEAAVVLALSRLLEK